MIVISNLIEYIDNLLLIKQFSDYAPNGLHIEGRPQVRRLACAVTASLDAIEQAVAWQADALLVHHGYFWKGENPCIVGVKKKRISHCLAAGMNLLAYHLPLDAHPTLGNNAQLASILGLTASGPLAGEPFLWSGYLESAETVPVFETRLRHRLHSSVQHLNGGPHTIERVAWCSGAGQKFIEQAAAVGADAFISGELSESTYHLAREWGIHYFGCGHHATERYGVQALGEHLAARFGVEYRYIELDNPL